MQGAGGTVWDAVRLLVSELTSTTSVSAQTPRPGPVPELSASPTHDVDLPDIMAEPLVTVISSPYAVPVLHADPG